MAPNVGSNSAGNPIVTDDIVKSSGKHYKREIVWKNVILFAYFHFAAVYGFYLLFSVKWYTIIWTALLIHTANLGITAGAHRLWTHKAYKAKLPLQIFLMICNSTTFQNSIYVWSRDHRMHHKYSETDADPHNAMRGFFFSHVGWLLCKKHPAIKEKGNTINMSDLEANSVVMFQKKYYFILMPLFTFVLPTLVPMYCWNESILNSYFVCGVFRYVWSLNMTWLVNSAAHMWGSKPYDKNINPVENLLVTLGTSGEGWHNFHHVFPWDYKAAELGGSVINLTTCFIDLMARIGWAYDLKTVPRSVVEKRALRTGDGQHSPAHPWGWGDEGIPKDDAQVTSILYKKD